MPAVTWLDVVKTQLAANPGKSVKDVVPAARKEWNLIKSGKHPTKTKGKMVVKRRKGTKKHRRHPHKGQPSRTRPGRLAFRTHKGDKYFHEKGHVVKKGYAPYTRRRKHHKKRGGSRSLRAGMNPMDMANSAVDAANKALGNKPESMTDGDASSPDASSSDASSHHVGSHDTQQSVKTVMSGGRRRRGRKSKGRKSKKALHRRTVFKRGRKSRRRKH
jgi:hypothetical protein